MSANSYTEEQRRLAWAAYYAQQQQLLSQPQQPDGYTPEQREAAWTAYYARLAAYQQPLPQAALGHQQQPAAQLVLPSDCWPDGTPKRFKTSRPAAGGTAGGGLRPQPRPAVEADASSAETDLVPEPALKRRKPTESLPSARAPALAPAPMQPSVAALCAAAATGDVRETRRQLEGGVNINGLGPDGKSALMLACEHGDSIVAVALLDATPPPAINQKGKEGKAALHYAIINDDKASLPLSLACLTLEPTLISTPVFACAEPRPPSTRLSRRPRPQHCRWRGSDPARQLSAQIDWQDGEGCHLFTSQRQELVPIVEAAHVTDPM